MEYIREMLLRQRTALGRLMLGGGSAEEPEAAPETPPKRTVRSCGWSWPGSVQNGSIRPPSDRLAPERPPILPGGGIP